MQWIIDRITEGIAVIETENGTHITMRQEYLPAGAKEGSVLRVDKDGMTLDKQAEDALRQENFDLQEALFH